MMLACLGFISGCSQLLIRQTCVALSPSINYCLAPLPLEQRPLPSNKEKTKSLKEQPIKSDLDPNTSLSTTNKILLTIGQEQHELLTQIEVQANKITLVGLAPLGQALFTLVYDGEQLISEQSPFLGEQFKPEYLMAIMQLIYWPKKLINSHLSSGVLVSKPCNKVHCRYLLTDAASGTETDEIIVIHYSDLELWQAHIDLSIPAGNFKLNITPL